MSWTSSGNLSTITLPAPVSGDVQVQTYEYDTSLDLFVTETHVNDFTSSATYDPVLAPCCQ